MKSLEVRYQVVFKFGQFLGMRNTGSYNPWSTDEDGNTHSKLVARSHAYIEVIGNIYENGRRRAIPESIRAPDCAPPR
jgi:hypothetical protein